jgi:hypothetical protein
MKRWLLIGGVLFALAAFAIAVVAVRAPRQRARIACQPASRGEYRTLARIDAEGYVHPLAGLTLDDGARWELVIDDVYEGTKKIADLSRIKDWQQMRFGCTGGDYGTPETSLRILRNGALVYAADVVLGEGLKVEGYAQLLRFRASPEALATMAARLVPAPSGTAH